MTLVEGANLAHNAVHIIFIILCNLVVFYARGKVVVSYAYSNVFVGGQEPVDVLT